MIREDLAKMIEAGDVTTVAVSVDVNMSCSVFDTTLSAIATAISTARLRVRSKFSMSGERYRFIVATDAPQNHREQFVSLLRTCQLNFDLEPHFGRLF